MYSNFNRRIIGPETFGRILTTIANTSSQRVSHVVATLPQGS